MINKCQEFKSLVICDFAVATVPFHFPISRFVVKNKLKWTATKHKRPEQHKGHRLVAYYGKSKQLESSTTFDAEEEIKGGKKINL